MLMLRRILALQLVLAVTSCGETKPASGSGARASRPASTVVTSESVADFDRSDAYTLAGLRASHSRMAHGSDGFVVLVSFFGNGRLNVVQHCYIFADGGNGMIRYVQNWAIQGGGEDASFSRASMPVAQRSELDAAIKNLPPSGVFSRDEDAFFVSWKVDGTWATRVYDRTSLSPEILRFCDLVNIPRTWF